MVWKIVWTIIFVPCASMAIFAMWQMTAQFVRGARRHRL